MEIKKCAFCQKEFSSKNKRQIYCCRDCSNKMNQQRIKERNEEKRLTGKKCLKCEKIFIPKKYGMTRRYCFDCVPDGLSNGAQIRNIIKKWGLEYLGSKCSRCGYNKCVTALEFHHKDGSEKEFGISDRDIVLDWIKIKQELDKCEVLCANCHREEHSRKEE